MVGCVCQGRGTECLHNYHLGNYRAHAQLAIKYSILLQRSPKQFQTGLSVWRGAAPGMQGCGVSVSVAGDLHWHVLWPTPEAGFWSLRWEVPVLLTQGWSQSGRSCAQDRASVLACRAGSEYVSGIRGLPLSYGTVGGGQFLGWGSTNVPLLLRAMLEQLCVDTLVTCSLGICSRVRSRADPRSCLLLQLRRSPT